MFDTLVENVSERLYHAPAPPDAKPRIDLKADMFSKDTWRLVDRYLCQCSAEEGEQQYRLYRQGMVDCVSLLKELGVLA